MAAATRNDKPDRFPVPATIVPVTVCRLSGKLATDDCRGSVVFDRDGHPTDRSMVYTEYFVRGTEPIDYCPLHSRPFDVVATSGDATVRPTVAATSGDVPPAAIAPVDHLREPPTSRPEMHPVDAAPTATVGTAPAPATAVPATPAARKRGFWGHIFRR